MTKKHYIIRRQDFFEAMAKNQIPEDSLGCIGSLWVNIFLNDEEKQNYTFPIWEENK